MKLVSIETKMIFMVILKSDSCLYKYFIKKIILPNKKIIFLEKKISLKFRSTEVKL